MRAVYVREDLCELFHLLMHKGKEIYISQDGLTMDRELGKVTYRITATVTQEGYIHVENIERRSRWI